MNYGYVIVSSLIIFLQLSIVPMAFTQEANKDKKEEELSHEMQLLDVDPIWTFRIHDATTDNLFLFKNNNRIRHFPDKLLPEADALTEQAYVEDLPRRFDVVFFLSTPVFLMYHLALAQVITSAVDIRGNDNPGILQFSSHQWIYAGVSSILLGLMVSFDDYRKITEKEMRQNQVKLNTISATEKELSNIALEKQEFKLNFFVAHNQKWF